MCYAIIKVKYRVNETAQMEAEHPDALHDRIASLEANEEVTEYRVFVTTGKRKRISAWEDG